MQCYICESQRQPTAGLMRVVSEAAGVCYECGIGLCLQHGRREGMAGAPFLCSGCASTIADAQPATSQSVPPAARTLVSAH